MMTDQMLQALVQAGGMGVVAAYALYVLGGKMDKLTSAVVDLHERIAVLLDRGGNKNAP